MRIRFCWFCIVFLLVFSSCKVTKFVPEGEYLLDKVEIKTEQQKVKKEDLERYIRQTPNSSVFGIWRMQLRLYSTAGRDTTKWVNRVLMRAGEAPVIYDEAQTYLSEQSLKKAMENKGYMHAEVSSVVTTDKKKTRVSYFIKENTPYRLRDYSVDLQNESLKALAADSVNTLVRRDMLFDVDVLNSERERITTNFREEGYYKFNKELLTYLADSAFRSNQIDLEMRLLDIEQDNSDSIYNAVFNKYYIRNVVFFTSRDVGTISTNFNRERDDFQVETQDKYILVGDKERFLKINTLVENTFIEPHKHYSDAAVQRTYTALNALPPVKYVNINFREVGTDSLDCLITIAPAKYLSLTAEVEATYTEGYWGVATNLGTVHRNVFKGAESLSLQGRLAYEWQGEGVLARELGGQASLLFPNFLMPFTSSDFRHSIRANTEFTANMNFQDRPREFEVKNFGLGMKYGWTQSRYRHTLELLDISYVDFRVEDEFWNSFIETNKFNRYNYEDHLITRIGYIGSFSTFNPNRPLRNHLSMRYSIETAGNLLYAFNNMLNSKKNEDGLYTVIGNIPYSQYARADYNITYHQIVDENNRFVYHFGMGAGTPYGNGTVIPYERRYFAGGANSVRGWAESKLGPGVYQSDGTIRGRDYNQVGDIKLDINAEYRYKMFGILNGALFVDAGNIWTVKPYDTQPGGEFHFNSFYKQIALSYGIGLRLDFSFLVVRLDLGIKLYDPVLPQDDRWRLKLGSNDFALHFAIGYPF
ncbi:BamA/TamA family outer membrane protein [Paludibacter sp. 221]|uniref:translocation and assembly module lipoprotein TamL n=1 Tax=Paludibacter sp. 221 TaxID=2302939 RepID=UPI0013D7097C|nr:BamA/TamA family outer membrane protein [Paludibacter sp. 221]